MNLVHQVSHYELGFSLSVSEIVVDSDFLHVEHVKARFKTFESNFKNLEHVSALLELDVRELEVDE